MTKKLDNRTSTNTYEINTMSARDDPNICILMCIRCHGNTYIGLNISVLAPPPVEVPPKEAPRDGLVAPL